MKKKISYVTLFVFLTFLVSNCSKDADNISFETVEIPTIVPATGPGDTEVTITISGLGSNTNLDNIQVFFNELEAVVTNTTLTQVTAIVPRGAMTGSVAVVANGQKITGPEFTYIITRGQVTTLTGTGSPDILEGALSDVAIDTRGLTISIDSENNLYISEFGGKRVRKIDSDLMVTILTNREKPAQAVFANSFTKTTQNGDLISCNSTEHTIELISRSNGMLTTLAGTGTGGNTNGPGAVAQFSTPTGVDVDSDDNIYICDSFNHSIRKISPTNEVTTIAGTGEEGFINGSPTIAQFAIPTGITIAQDGTLFITDFRNHAIRKIATDGTVSNFAGTGVVGFADGLAGTAQFNFPTGITISKDGDLYVIDSGNHRIRKITPNGIVSTYAGSGEQGSADGFLSQAGFDFIGEGIFVAGGIAIDANDIIYVTTLGAIRKITPEF